MKKRLRKKLHKGEFQQFGVSIMVPANTENVDTLLDTLTDIAERHDTIFCGCGLGRLVLPSDEYDDLKIPAKVSFLAMAFTKDPQILSDYIVGYYINPAGKEIAADVAEKINAELGKTLKTDFKINLRVGLWDNSTSSKLYANCMQIKLTKPHIFL